MAENAAALLKKFRSLQEERVHTYRLFDEGFQAYLATAPNYDFTKYRQMVHEITESFNTISAGIIDIQNQLSEQPSLTGMADCIGRVQLLEKSKLEQTAELQIVTQKIVDCPRDASHKERALELKQQLRTTVDEINDQLEELKYEAEDLV